MTVENFCHFGVNEKDMSIRIAFDNNDLIIITWHIKWSI
jgi:hypothetical protein